jgi:hypothetical protein
MERKAITWTDSAGQVKNRGTDEKTTFRADSSRQQGRPSGIGKRPCWIRLPRAVGCAGLLSMTIERAARRYRFPDGALRNREGVLLNNFQW